MCRIGNQKLLPDVFTCRVCPRVGLISLWKGAPMIRRWLSPLPTLIALAALTLLLTAPIPADEPVPGESPDGALCRTTVQLDPSEDRVLLAPPCGPGETQHTCDIQDGCTGRHFRDTVCCGAGTTGDCLVAVNGLGCVESVDAVCVPNP